MQLIKASEFGIMPNEDITVKLAELCRILQSTDGEKTVVFENGTYYIDSKKCEQYALFITNTVGDKEFKKNEKPHINAVPFYFSNISDITIDANDSIFVIDGKVTNIAMENCENITLKNMEIRHSHPDMHELKVVGKNKFSVDFELDRDTLYKFKKGKLWFYGNDYCVQSNKSAFSSWWIGLIKTETPDKIQRVRHPLATTYAVRDLDNRRIRAYCANTTRFDLDDCFYVYDVRRQFAGIFINKCKNVTLYNIKQRFNYSLAVVAQDSDTITINNVCFAPEVGSARKLASVADFIQICMCRGKVSVKDSYFDGAGDDCLNVHGVHFKITQVNGNEITVRFMHPQSHGYNPLRVGDTVAFINSTTLLENGTAVIEKSELVNEYDIKLKLDSTEKAVIGEVIEDISACPEVEFVNNKMTRIITRGILLTTRGKSIVSDNRFVSTTMSGILLSDDAKNWYESGMCCDVTIERNTFDYCGDTPILIKPENRQHEGAVHKNIKICDNKFKDYSGTCIDAKSTDSLIIKNNDFGGGEYLKTNNCTNVIIE
ncbi:MAG: right-handed parallel beta-helix repeat-containing protein [Faecalibacterium sp.]|nr:right-handed parallel beta-helix repeat-containing protein [Ruminococcus sp.]MCM1391675.1 right-handed parallel beta-helix repeat-containing protein [Ruminococcus sp.]MCM1485983.1 right-handed parallel beta-helix repeat-containing protein [Faecalibacterium sp.]